MYRPGHLGVSLLLFAPVGAVLVLLDAAALALVGGTVVLWLATPPDVDHRIPGVSHRGVTHTLAFALLVGAALGAAGAALGSVVSPGRALSLAAAGLFFGTFGVCAHLAGDVLTPSGVPLLWPLSSRRYSVSLTRADSTVWNYALFAGGVFVTGGTVIALLRFGAVGGA